MAHPVLTKGFLLLSPEAAMLPGPKVATHTPPPVPPFLQVQNLTLPKVTSKAKRYMTHIRLMYTAHAKP